MALNVNIDDLVAALASNHIGQDAIDIAALQAQLSQALLAHSLTSCGHDQHCNTPTGRTRTPSLSFSCPMTDATQSHHTIQRHLASPLTADEFRRDSDELDQEEQMVEDLLLPSSPRNSSPPRYLGPVSRHQHHHHQPAQTQLSTSNCPPPPPLYTCATEASAANCLFTSTDPFYMAQLQAAQNYTHVATSSFFSQTGRPSQHSPFLIHHQQQYQQQRPADTCDGHSLYVVGSTTAVAYDR